MLFMCGFALADLSEGASVNTNEMPGAGMNLRGALNVAAGLDELQRYTEAAQVLKDYLDNNPEDAASVYLPLGLMYMKADLSSDAEQYLKKAAAEDPLLKDYALKALAGMYMDMKEYVQASETARRITLKLLLKEARQTEILALLETGPEVEAEKALAGYVAAYDKDWDYRLRLAKLLRKRGQKQEAVRHYRELYLSASRHAQKARRELELMQSAQFSADDLFRRAGNLFDAYQYSMAEKLYGKLLSDGVFPDKITLLYRKGRSQFRQKKYTESSKTFGKVGGPKSLYWQAKSLYRLDRRADFEKVRSTLEKRFPGHELLAKLHIMAGDDHRRAGRLAEAENDYRRALKSFPESTEDALWGIAWMNYNAGKYQKALPLLRRLTGYEASRDHHKYLYWMARTEGRLAEKCMKMTDSEKARMGCPAEEYNYFEGLPFKENFYGFLIMFESLSFSHAGEYKLTKPEKPSGQAYDRIEALAAIGLKAEAVQEIRHQLNSKGNTGSMLYLGYLAMSLGEYKKVIEFAEPRTGPKYLPYSYPRGFWTEIKEAAEASNIDRYLVSALIREESRYQPDVQSWAGAIGLMQLMPATASRMKRGAGVIINGRDDLTIPAKNIKIGTYYLAGLIREFDDISLAVAAYNAGENRVRTWVKTIDSEDIVQFIENIPYKETRQYVQRVMKSYWQYRRVNGLTAVGAWNKGAGG